MRELAVVIVTHNRCARLRQTLDALQAATADVGHDVYVLDNASSDDTAAMLASRSEVRTLRSEENLGGAGGFEKVLRHVHALGYAWYWCLDDDGAPAPDALMRLRNEMACHTGDVILGCNLLSNEGGDEPFWFPLGPYEPGGKTVRRGRPVARMRPGETSCEVTVVPQAGMYFSRRVLERLGFPDGRLFFTYEDNEFCFRAWRHGVPVRLVPGAVIRHPPMRVQYSWLGPKRWRTVLHSVPRFYYLVRNRLYIDWQYLRFREFVLSAAELSYDALVHLWVWREPRYLVALIRGMADAARAKLGPRFQSDGNSRG
jgi:GT2 family glycosyltransferase